jgi:hypothetical protein
LGATGDYSTSEVATTDKWIDGKTIYRQTFTVASVTPGVTGTTLGSIATLDTVVRFEGFGSTANSTTGYVVPLGGSGFAVAVRRNGATLLTGPASAAIYNVYLTVWYTKVA